MPFFLKKILEPWVLDKLTKVKFVLPQKIFHLNYVCPNRATYCAVIDKTWSLKANISMLVFTISIETFRK